MGLAGWSGWGGSEGEQSGEGHKRERESGGEIAASSQVTAMAGGTREDGCRASKGLFSFLWEGGRRELAVARAAASHAADKQARPPFQPPRHQKWREKRTLPALTFHEFL